MNYRTSSHGGLVRGASMGCRRRRERVEKIGEDMIDRSSSGDHQKDETEHSSDRLSELPDSLLVEILSLLPMEDAVRTGILCKRWENLWTLVNRIRFHFDINDNRGLHAFISFVDHTLRQFARPNLKEFSLRIADDYTILDPTIDIALDKWLQCVSSKNVKFLELGPVGCRYSPPKWFYHNPSMEKLELSYCEVQISEPVNWFSLKNLSLKYVCINEDEMRNILLGCPLLDTLILDGGLIFSSLNITSPKLRKLKVLNLQGYEDSPDYALLEISAPLLKELEISGEYTAAECCLVDVSSLVFAKLSFAHELEFYEGNVESLLLDLADKVLHKLHHVQELIIGSLFVQALSLLKLLGRPCPLFKCKYLTVESTLLKCELPGIACLLQNLPHLETLTIEMVNPEEQYCGGYLTENFNNNQEDYLNMQNGKFLHLKNVKVVDGRNLCLHDESKHSDIECFDVEIVAYLLKNACFLEKIVITSQINNLCECSINCSWQYLSSLSNKFLNSCLDGNGVAQCRFDGVRIYANLVTF